MDKKGNLFSQMMLTWHADIDRGMPWKDSKDPYLIWLSEIILQQTRVDQGRPYFERIRNKYPDIHALAAASDDAFFSVWEGLGYYSRARNMLSTARYIAHEQSGVFPNTYEGLLSLKGVGPYTAAAISSFAHNLPYAVADGNVYRVLARYFGVFDSSDTATGKKVFSALANSLIPSGRSSDYNQAIMDFGALVCKPFQPQCNNCPLSQSCFAFANSSVDTLPVRAKKPTKKERFFTFLLCRDEEGLLCRRREDKDVWRGLFELPSLESTVLHPNPESSLEEVFDKLPGVLIGRPRVLGSSKQVLSHQVIHGIFVDVAFKRLNSNEVYKFINFENLGYLAFPKILRNFIDEYVNLRQ